jgi:hypothetical protein
MPVLWLKDLKLVCKQSLFHHSSSICGMPNCEHDAPVGKIHPVARVPGPVHPNTVSTHVPDVCQAPVFFAPHNFYVKIKLSTRQHVQHLCDCMQTMPRSLRTFTMCCLLLFPLGVLATGVLCTSPPGVRIRRCALMAAAHKNA